MLELAGQDLTNYFPPPLYVACPNLVSDDTMQLMYQSWAASVPTAIHYSGNLQSDSNTALDTEDWLTSTFQPFMKQYHKGPLVYTHKNVSKTADIGSSDDQTAVYYGIYDGGVYDLTNYFYTAQYQTQDKYQFLDDTITNLFKNRQGEDLTNAINSLSESQINSTSKANTLDCMRKVFFVGHTDPRETARCEFQPYLLLAFTCVIIAVLAIKVSRTNPLIS